MGDRPRVCRKDGAKLQLRRKLQLLREGEQLACGANSADNKHSHAFQHSTPSLLERNRATGLMAGPARWNERRTPCSRWIR
jgi:hypothetical protein